MGIIMAFLVTLLIDPNKIRELYAKRHHYLNNAQKITFVDMLVASNYRKRQTFYTFIW